MEQPHYEFTAAQNETIRVLARRMRFVGIFITLVGILAAISGMASLFSATDRHLYSVNLGLADAIPSYTTLLLAALYIIIGSWTVKAAGSFQLIADTEDYDIEYLMDALVSLRKLYGMQFWVLVIGAVISIIIVVFVFVGR